MEWIATNWTPRGREIVWESRPGGYTCRIYHFIHPLLPDELPYEWVIERLDSMLITEYGEIAEGQTNTFEEAQAAVEQAIITHACTGPRPE